MKYIIDHIEYDLDGDVLPTNYPTEGAVIDVPQWRYDDAMEVYDEDDDGEFLIALGEAVVKTIEWDWDVDHLISEIDFGKYEEE